MGIDLSAFGKRVIFVHPPAVIDEIASELARQEFETCIAKDHDRLPVLLRGDARSIVFVDIDDGLKEPEWETWIRSRMKDNPSLGIGIITLNGGADLAGKYLMDVGVQCGFVILKIGTARAAEIIVKTLDANEARGRRKFVRATCQPGAGELNLGSGSDLVRGSILDISSAGIAMAFPDGRSYPAGAILRDVQLNLHGALLTVSAVVVGGRAGVDERKIVVAMFDPHTLDDTKREKLRMFVRRCLQESFERELAGMV